MPVEAREARDVRGCGQRDKSVRRGVSGRPGCISSEERRQKGDFSCSDLFRQLAFDQVVRSDP